MKKTSSQYNKEWRARNPDATRNVNIRIWAKRYGITVEQLIELQKGPCILCGTSKSGGKAGRFHVDHKHGTKIVRGSLCAACNIMIGQIEKALNNGLLAKAIEYLKRFD